jgi:hypothetical protein
MSSLAKTKATNGATVHRLSDSEILLFVSRSLQPQLDDADASSVLAKLQALKDIRDLQEAILADFPDGPGKIRMADTLARSKQILAQIGDDLLGTARHERAAASANSP